MSQEIDFDQLIDLLDRALTSKDPKVMLALKKFLFIAALATEDTEEEGPFKNLIRRIETLEQNQNNTYTWTTYPNGPGSPYPGGGTWINAGSPTHYYNGGTSTTTTASYTIDDWNNFSSTIAKVDAIDENLEDLGKIASESLAK